MANSKEKELVLSTFNCHNVKSSIGELQELCEKSDIIFLQETWLLESELGILDTISNKFYSKGISSVKHDSGVLRGRPHGGLAILWRKELDHCKVINMMDDRIMGFEIKCNDKKLFFVNLYMPFCNRDNLELFMFYLGKINSIITDADTPYVYIVGDLNSDFF